MPTWRTSHACQRGQHGACLRRWPCPSGLRFCTCACHPPPRLTLPQLGVNTQVRPVGTTLGWRRDMQRDTGGRRYPYRRRGFGATHQVDHRGMTPN